MATIVVALADRLGECLALLDDAANRTYVGGRIFAGQAGVLEETAVGIDRKPLVFGTAGDAEDVFAVCVATLLVMCEESSADRKRGFRRGRTYNRPAPAR